MRYSLCLVFYCIQHGKQNQPGMTDRSFQSHRPSSFSHQQRGSSGREEEEEEEGEEEEEEVRGKKVVGLSTCKHGKRKKKKTANRK